jgi:hypothetical protein
VSDDLYTSMKRLRALLLVQSLPEGLVESWNVRIDALLGQDLDPRNLTIEQQNEIAAILKEMDEHDALGLLG